MRTAFLRDSLRVLTVVFSLAGAAPAFAAELQITVTNN